MIGSAFASFRLALLCAAIVAFASFGASRTAAAQSPSIVGTWNLVWAGARDNYTGMLTVATKVNDKLFRGKLYLLKTNGQKVTEDASITVDGNDVRIECSNPSVKPWFPDRFYVVRSGNQMTGYSLDASGQRGNKIVFTRR